MKPGWRQRLSPLDLVETAIVECVHVIQKTCPFRVGHIVCVGRRPSSPSHGGGVPPLRSRPPGARDATQRKYVVICRNAGNGARAPSFFCNSFGRHRVPGTRSGMLFVFQRTIERLPEKLSKWTHWKLYHWR